MSSELAIGVVIGASVRAGFSTVFGRAKNTVKELGSEINNVRTQQERLGRSIAKGVATGRSGLGVLRERYDLLGRAIGKAEAAQGRLNRAIKAQENAKQHRANLRSEMAEAAGHAAVISAPVIASVKKFMEQENASADLKIAMMRQDGSFGKFEEIDRLTTKWGADLPGNKTDFSKMALGLKSQGISDDTIINGGGLATAQLNVVMDIPIADGSFFAKNMEAHGIKESELLKSADLTQRAYFAAGLKKEDMFEAMKYYAGKANTLGYTGLEHQKKIYAVEGMAATKGIEGSQFGTNFSTFLGNLSKGVANMEFAGKGRKGELRRIMESAGAKFDFFNADGSIKDLREVTGILESEFGKIKAKYGDKAVMDISNAMFGSEGGRVADILIQGGLKAFDEMTAKMDAQASLSDRIKVKTGTLSASLEALGGAAENAAAIFGSVFGADIKAAAQALQGLVENHLQPFLEKNKDFIKWGVGVAAGFFAAKLGILGLAYAGSMVLMPFRAVWTAVMKANAAFRLFQLMRLGKVGRLTTALRMFGLSAKTAAGISKGLGSAWRVLSGGAAHIARFAAAAGRVFAGGLVRMLSVSARAFLSFGGMVVRFVPLAAKALFSLGAAVVRLGLMMLANPIFLALGLLAGAAYLLYTNWDTVVAWSKALWQGLGDWFGGLWTTVSTAFQAAWNNITGFFSSGIANISATILNWSPVGLFYQAFAAVMGYFGIELPTSLTGFVSAAVHAVSNFIMTWSPVTAFQTAFAAVWGFLAGLPARFTAFGSQIIQGLANGITAGAGLVVSAISNMASSAMAKAKSMFGIHSPSRVFRSYGDFITRGLDIGIGKGAAKPVAAVGHMAGRLKQRFADRVGQLRSDIAARVSGGSGEFAAARAQREQETATAAANGAITVNFNPTIHAPGGNPDQIQTALQMGLREFEELFRRMMADRERRAY